jgi:hypothetical protein
MAQLQLLQVEVDDEHDHTATSKKTITMALTCANIEWEIIFQSPKTTCPSLNILFYCRVSLIFLVDHIYIYIYIY